MFPALVCATCSQLTLLTVLHPWLQASSTPHHHAASTSWMAATKTRPYCSCFTLLIILSYLPVHDPFFSPSSWAISCSIILLVFAESACCTATYQNNPTKPLPAPGTSKGAQLIRLPCRASVGTHVHSKTWLTPTKCHFYSSNGRVGFPTQVTLSSSMLLPLG